MAKDTFFIRKTVDIGNTNAFFQGEIDLGSYVNALGKSILKIHGVTITYSDNTGRSSTVQPGTAVAQWQLTTQSQTDIVRDDNKSLISSGRCHFRNASAAPALASTVTEANGINPQEFVDGYLVAVEQIYLGGAASTLFSGDVYVTAVLECTVGTMTESKAMALALSQQ